MKEVKLKVTMNKHPKARADIGGERDMRRRVRCVPAPHKQTLMKKHLYKNDAKNYQKL